MLLEEYSDDLRHSSTPSTPCRVCSVTASYFHFVFNVVWTQCPSTACNLLSLSTTDESVGQQARWTMVEMQLRCEKWRGARKHPCCSLHAAGTWQIIRVRYCVDGESEVDERRNHETMLSKYRATPDVQMSADKRAGN